MTLVLRPSAKINLTLEVGARRADGFHDVRTVLQAIALGDRLTITARRGPLTLTGHAPGVSLGRDNLVWRAADLLWRAVGRTGPARDVQLHLRKTIPAAAGLGGGSADAAATLAGLNHLWRGRLTRARLAALAGRLGSDVPFFFCGGTALGLGRGEDLYPLPDMPRHLVVIVTSPHGISTADAYRWLDDDDEVRPRAARPAGSVEVGWPSGPLAVRNDLQAPVVRRHPSIGHALAALRRHGAAVAAMTGSGSAVFGLFPAVDIRRVTRAAEGLARDGRHVLLTRTLSRRESLRRIDPVVNS
jgi:4-diphosphocytidyl-2-C-methyl-D-erythritol kinase